MNSPTSQSSDKKQIEALYRQFLDGWNSRDAVAIAAPCAEDAVLIGFDGSQNIGRAEILATLSQIFADHLTPPYVSKVREVRLLTSDTAILRAVVGMVPSGQFDIAPALNAIQTIVAVRADGTWHIALIQTTPAQFHGRPELVEQLTDELRQLL
jgi:uncharacterized protein (TIGR02246 family)